MDDSTFADFKTKGRERVDVLVGVERRRRWGRVEKLRIVRESLAPNAVVSDVARRNEVSASLIYVWRRQALAGLMEGFHPVRIIAQPQGLVASEVASVDLHVVSEARLQHDGAVDAKALRAVLGALVDR